MKLQIYKNKQVKTPHRGTDGSAGYDFFIPVDISKKEMESKLGILSSIPLINYNLFGCVDTITLKSGQSVLIPSGIHIKLEKGYCMEMKNKSGVASKKNLVLGSCVIDQDFSGEIHINLHNIGDVPVTIEAGDKIVQGVILKVETPEIEEFKTFDELYPVNTKRGAGELGSTGTK